MILFYPGQISNMDVCSPSLSSEKVVRLVHCWLCTIQIFTKHSQIDNEINWYFKVGLGFDTSHRNIFR